MDVWDVSNEFVISQHAEAFATSAYLFFLTSAYAEPWVPAPVVEIFNAPVTAEVGGTYTMTGTSSEADLSEGRVIWEATGQDIAITSNYTVKTDIARTGWAELEVLWPDGKRSFARAEFAVTEKIAQDIEQSQPTPAEHGEGPYGKILGNGNVRFYYPLDNDFKDVMGQVRKLPGAAEDAYDLASEGSPEFDTGNFEWPGYAITRSEFRAARLEESKDLLFTMDRTIFAEKLFPPHTQWISVESIVFIEGFEENEGASYLFALDIEALAQPVRLWLFKDPYRGPITGVYGQTQVTEVNDLIPLKTWVYVRAVMDRELTTLYLNGEQIDQVPTEVFETWINPGSRIKLLFGGFIGFATDLIIKAGTGAKESLDATVPPPLTGFNEWQDLRFFDQPSESKLPTADPDGDGRSNLLEYALGSEPWKSDTIPALTLLRQPDDRLTLGYRRPIDRADVTYAIQHSQDLVSWKTFEPDLVPSATQDDGVFRIFQYDDPKLQPNQQLQHLPLMVTLN
jgi:hypothetical protein